MGDNAKKSWEWHNTVVGEGYIAKGVIRQRTAPVAAMKSIDMTEKAKKPVEMKEAEINSSGSSDSSESEKAHNKSKKHKRNREENGDKTKKKERKDSKRERKEKKKKKHKKGSEDYAERTLKEESIKLKFNPILQLLADHLSIDS